MKTVKSQRTYSVNEISELLGLSVCGTYNLFHSHDFPAFSIGKRLFVTREAFEKWLEEQQRKEA